MARYFLRFRHSDTGLTPTFLFFKKSSDLSAVTPPSIGEVGGGTYYFDFSPTFDIIFEVDGGVSIPTEEVRYVSDTISERDTYVDEPVSQVHDDVWNDADNRAPGTKGEYVETVGLPADNSAQPTLFGRAALLQADTDDIQTKLGVPATTIAGAVDAINIETDAASIANAVWNEALAGHVTAGTAGKIVQDIESGVAAVNTETDPANIANAVWNEVLTTHITANSGGDMVTRVFKILKNRTKIDATADTLTVYDDDGTTPLFEFDLKDKLGAPSGEKPFERVPA